MAGTKQAPASRPSKKRSVEEWAALALHDVTLPSGMEAVIRFADIPALIKSGRLPDQLQGAAARRFFGSENGAAASDGDGEDGAKAAIDDAQRIEIAKATAELYEYLVLESVVEPELTAEHLPRLPAEDKEMLIEVSLRERDTDALGRTLGVEPLSRWETFRREHKCSKSCAHCEAAQHALSTRRSL